MFSIRHPIPSCAAALALALASPVAAQSSGTQTPDRVVLQEGPSETHLLWVSEAVLNDPDSSQSLPAEWRDHVERVARGFAAATRNAPGVCLSSYDELFLEPDNDVVRPLVEITDLASASEIAVVAQITGLTRGAAISFSARPMLLVEAEVVEILRSSLDLRAGAPLRFLASGASVQVDSGSVCSVGSSLVSVADVGARVLLTGASNEGDSDFIQVTTISRVEGGTVHPPLAERFDPTPTSLEEVREAAGGGSRGGAR